MDRDLEDACVRVGWDALYERYIPEGMRPENMQGERAARSPFPFSNDNQASFSVNVRSGLWKCWHSQPITGLRGGNYVQFVALMNATIDSDGRPVPDYPNAERELRVELGLARPVDIGWLENTRMMLAHEDSAGHRMWIGHKPWNRAGLTRLGIGWDQHTGRLVIPTLDARGRVANCRMYRPGGQPKMLWSAPGLSGNFLFPHTAWQEPWVVLVEGEPDVITLRCYGYNACSGTMGSGSPVPEGRWWVGKRVFVWMDADAPGEEATATACRILRDGAQEVRVVQMPEWEGRPSNADASNYIMHLLSQGMYGEQVQREITRLLSESRLVESASSVYDAAPTRVDFRGALTTANAGQKIEFAAKTLGKSAEIYSLAVRLNVQCPGTGHNWCNTCVMHTQWHGDANITLDPRAALTLKLIQTQETMRDYAFKEHIRIPQRCPEPRFEVIQSVDVEVSMLGSTVTENEENTAGASHKRHEALVVVPAGRRLEENVDYTMQGFVYPAPRSQQQVFLLDGFERIDRAADRFVLDRPTIEHLISFVPRGDVVSALSDVSHDIAESTTGIRGRLDLHVMLRSVWHSVLAFEFGGMVHRRGWLEALVVGDTRCGKSATFRKMAEMYGTGMLVDCKMQSPAGMLGAVETSMMTGERFVIAGLYPQQDGAGPVCMDEFSTSKWERRAIMDHMSSTRAEGMVRITKAAHATFMARVRAIWMANPGAGRLMREMGGYGVEAIARLIDQPEDIARFDLAMAVSQADVPFSEINRLHTPTTPRWSPDAHRSLLAWGWSRKPTQICWVDGAETAVVALAESMSNKYDAEIPIVEPADQRMRIAKLCVSIAAQCFSTDDDMQYILVRPEHVYAAYHMYCMWYDKPTFGYDRFSLKARIERTLLDEGEVEAALDKALGASRLILADRISRLHQFNEKVLSVVLPINFMELRGFTQTLSINRCIRMVRGTRDLFELTPGFVEFLHRYIQKNGGIQ